jgi:hypothetical protein
VDASRWSPYGGISVGPLQFASTGILAGYAPVDVNAFQGERSQLASIIGAPVRRRRSQEMGYIIDPTPPKPGAQDTDKPDGSWPAVEYTLTTPGPVGGWPGRELMHWTPGYLGAFVQECWSRPSGKHYVPRWDPTTSTGGVFVDSFDTQNIELPPGDTALILRLATRAKGSAIPETQT